jgi:hypothetical protein
VKYCFVNCFSAWVACWINCVTVEKSYKIVSAWSLLIKADEITIQRNVFIAVSFDLHPCMGHLCFLEDFSIRWIKGFTCYRIPLAINCYDIWYKVRHRWCLRDHLRGLLLLRHDLEESGPQTYQPSGPLATLASELGGARSRLSHRCPTFCCSVLCEE